jgi:hypothetical protein
MLLAAEACHKHRRPRLVTYLARRHAASGRTTSSMRLGTSPTPAPSTFPPRQPRPGRIAHLEILKRLAMGYPSRVTHHKRTHIGMTAQCYAHAAHARNPCMRPRFKHNSPLPSNRRRHVACGAAPSGIQRNQFAVNLDHPGGGRVWLLIVRVSVFDSHVCFPGPGGCVTGPVCPGAHRLRPRRVASFRVAEMVRAGQVSAGRPEIRCQQVTSASFHRQSRLIFRVRRRAWRTSLAGTCHRR